MLAGLSSTAAVLIVRGNHALPPRREHYEGKVEAECRPASKRKWLSFSVIVASRPVSAVWRRDLSSKCLRGNEMTAIERLAGAEKAGATILGSMPIVEKVRKGRKGGKTVQVRPSVAHLGLAAQGQVRPSV